MTDQATWKASRRDRLPELDPATQRLEAIALEVVTDAQERPERYARETIVPEGGE